MYQRHIIIALLICSSLYSKAQINVADIDLIQEKQLINPHELAHYKRKGNDTKVMQLHSKSTIAKLNPIAWVMQSGMFLYQNVLSPQLSKSCPYQLTCSNFCKQAITQYGILKGILMGADRLTRCNRISILDVSPLSIDESTGSIIDSLNSYRRP